MGSNVPPITPIRPPATDRAYPVFSEAGPLGTGQPGAGPAGTGPDPVPRMDQRLRTDRRPRRDPATSGGTFRGNPAPGCVLITDRRNEAVPSTRRHPDKARPRQDGSSTRRQLDPAPCRPGAMSTRRRGGSERRDEVGQLGRVAALHHVDDLAVLVG